jgi:hypothetical protein
MLLEPQPYRTCSLGEKKSVGDHRKRVKSQPFGVSLACRKKKKSITKDIITGYIKKGQVRRTRNRRK